MIMSDRNHALSMCYELLPSGRRYRCLKVKPRTQKSFIPYSIRLLNSPHDHSTCYLEVCMVDAIVILHAAHYVVVYCSSMLFMYCM